MVFVSPDRSELYETLHPTCFGSQPSILIRVLGQRVHGITSTLSAHGLTLFLILTFAWVARNGSARPCRSNKIPEAVTCLACYFAMRTIYIPLRLFVCHHFGLQLYFFIYFFYKYAKFPLLN